MQYGKFLDRRGGVCGACETSRHEKRDGPFGPSPFTLLSPHLFRVAVPVAVGILVISEGACEYFAD